MKKIGVFDSGLGGFAVLRHLAEEFPNIDFIYVADYAYNPYGTKEFKTIENRVIEIGKFLINEGVEAIIIACNTASLHVHSLRAITNLPVIEVISITSDYALERSQTKSLAVFATNKTIEMGSYQNYLGDKGAKVIGIKASEWVDAIESGEFMMESGKKIILDKVSLLNKEEFDIIVMGCTHFELVKDIILKEHPNYQIITSEKPTIMQLNELISVSDKNKFGEVIIYTTGEVTKDLIDKIEIMKITYASLNEVKI